MNVCARSSLPLSPEQHFNPHGHRTTAEGYASFFFFLRTTCIPFRALRLAYETEYSLCEFTVSAVMNVSLTLDCFEKERTRKIKWQK